MSNVAHITTVHIRTDTRILYKEVQSVCKRYNTKLIVADGLGNSNEGFVEVIDVGKPKNRLSRILFFGLKVLPVVKKNKITCVHIHDPELILIGLILRMRGVKVIFDIHELVYHDIKTKSWIQSKLVRNTIAGAYKILENLAFRYFNATILAEDGYKDYYEKTYKKYLHKISYVKNYPIKKMFTFSYEELIQPSKKENTIIYLGAISFDRGIYELVEAMQYLDDSYKLYIIGKWRDSNLLEKCESSEGWKKVEKLGYLKPDQIGEYIKKSKVGMCTLHRLENFAYTTPVKSFEYLINGVPLIMTDFDFWKSFYKEVSLFVDPKDSVEISKSIEKICSDDKLIDSMSKKGYQMALEHCWENEEKTLLNVYSKLI